MKNILIIAPFTQLPGELGNNRARFKTIAEKLVSENYKVTVVTSKFRELDRTYRKMEDYKKFNSYKIILLNDLGYKSNISLRRVMSQINFAYNLEKYLSKQTEKFDLIYSSVPGIESSLVASKFAKRNKIPFVIDVQDLWPEAMYDLVFDLPWISKIVFSPIQFMVNKVYSSADGIIAVSKTYLDVASKKNKKAKFKEYVYIGSNINHNSEIMISNNNCTKENGETWITYIGSLGHSYDIETFLKATKLVQKEFKSVKAVILGDGPLREKFEEYASKNNINVVFTGWVDKTTLNLYLNKSDILINAIKRKAPQSITNKISDYLSAGKPILNGSSNKEFMDLMLTYNIGLNYEAENTQSLKEKITTLLNMTSFQRSKLGDNALKLADLEFNRELTYSKIIEVIDDLLLKESK